MAEGTEVVRLGVSDRLELLELFTEAFREHPLIPLLDAKPEATGSLMKAFLDCFGGTEGTLLCGIRRDDRLVCASVSVDSTAHPSAPVLLRFIFALWRALGWRVAKQFQMVDKAKPKYQDRYLELVVLGTLPAYQKQGLGRCMLNFLYNEARKENYKGVILVADCATPAFRLYLKEGFAVDRDFSICEAPLSWMRRIS
jgi:ribosomal protein S18 acetylase RimI-like enzyme